MQKSSTRQWTMPTRLTLKINSGALGYLFYNGAPVSNSGRENRVSGSDYCACAEPILDLYLAIFMVQILDFGMGYLKNCLIH